MKLFGREPALWLEVLKAVLVGVALILPNVSNDVQAAIMVIATAVFALAQAVTTRPFQVTALTGFITTVGAAIAAFGIDVSPDVLAALIVLVGAVAALLSRSQVTPVNDPQPVDPELGTVPPR